MGFLACSWLILGHEYLNANPFSPKMFVLENEVYTLIGSTLVFELIKMKSKILITPAIYFSLDLA